MKLSTLLRSAALALIATTTAFAAPPAEPPGPVPTAAAGIRHVFIILLENKSYDDTFGSSTQDPYLQKTLVSQGALLTQYYGTGHVSLDNYLSLISGQAPTRDTANDCMPALAAGGAQYTDVRQTGWAAQGQVVASAGCVYGRDVPTLPGQLEAAGLSWRGYMQDMGNDPARAAASCGHPVPGGPDTAASAEGRSASVPEGDAYATRHNPFVYFHSIIDDKAGCARHVVNLDKLPADLARVRSTPNLVFITPNLCSDGHDGSGTGAPGTTCANGQPGGLTSIDAFLRTWVPRIMASPAFRRDGLLIISFDESNFTVHQSMGAGDQMQVDITFPGKTCCDQRPGPNLADARPGGVTLVDTPRMRERLVIEGYGGDRIGAVLLSPFIRQGSTSDTPYNHYSLLRSIEDIFHLRHLGYAADDAASHYHLDTIGADGRVFLPAATVH